MKGFSMMNRNVSTIARWVVSVIDQRQIRPALPFVAASLILASCGGGGGGSSAVIAPPTYLRSQFVDAPVAGLCFSDAPSGTTGITAADGSYKYVAGDTVNFWIDGSGSGCTGSTATSATSVSLGSTLPTGATTFVLTLNQGQQAADTLTALNIGTMAAMNVAGLKLTVADVSYLNAYIASSGTSLPGAAAGSIDAFFSTVQADTTTGASNSPPAYVTAVAASASTVVSVLENTVDANFQATLAAAAPIANVTVPASGSLHFVVSASEYQQLLQPNPTTEYSSISANFRFFDGAGNAYRINSPGGSVITAANLADQTCTGTYTVNSTAPQLSQSLNCTNANNGNLYTQAIESTIAYLDASESLSTNSYTRTYTTGANAGKVFQQGVSVTTGLLLTPLSLSVLGGHTITSAGSCGADSGGTGGGSLSLTFSSDGGTVTTLCSSPSSEALSLTVSTSAVPGILEMTDSTGFIIFVGLQGGSVAVGSQLVVIQENPGVPAEGGSSQWFFLPISSLK
jgi:hypothetical protein